MSTPGRITPRLASLLSIPAHRRSYGLLEGDWAAVFSGRSHDFDDLRPYVPGDDVRDIDWNATARNPVPLVKRYEARREQTVLFVVATGRELTGLAPDGGTKLEAARLVVELLSAVARSHGDSVAFVGGDAQDRTVLPGRRDDRHRAAVLAAVTAHPGSPAVDLAATLAVTAKVVRRRLLAVVVADDVDVDEDLRRAVRRLAVQHEVLWVTLADADPTLEPGPVRDVSAARRLPGASRRARRVQEAYAASELRRRAETTATLRACGVSTGRVEGAADVVRGVHELVDSHRRARR